MYPTSLVFKRGHRIRLDLSSSNFPRFDVNPNTGEPLGQQRRWAVAENSIYHDGEHPTHIVLPIIPRRDRAETKQKNNCSVALEELNGSLVPFRLGERLERPKVLAPACLRIFLAGVEPVLA
jgi:hypothetical protein